MRHATSLVLALLVLGQALCDDEHPVVTVAEGTLRGQKVTPDNLAPYYSFLGIPYAKPPVGNLRFKAPIPASPWNGTLEAIKEGHICVQPSRKSSATVGRENCLYLNVHTPQLPGSGSLKPVMVYIHGGGYLRGSGNKRIQGPQYLLNEGIVFVSINYRLGILGFLSTEDAAAPGNAGLKDQVLALRWVQQNIAAFGGDPNKVTIFGQSAGAVSVQYHMVSPISKGLFHAAIADSGTIISPRAVTRNPKENAFLVGNALGYNGNSTKELVKFLRTVNADKLVSTSLGTINKEDYFRIMKKFHEGPVVEPKVEGEEAFITENPRTLLEEGRFHKLPYMTGVNSAEGMLAVVMTSGDGRTMKEIDKDFTKVVKPELLFCKDETCGDEMTTKIKSFYFGDKSVSNDTLLNFIDMTTDLLFAVGALNGVRTMSQHSSQPAYFYHFSYDGPLAYTKLSKPILANIPGVSHKDELGYIFEFGVHVSNSSEAAKVRSRVVTMWTNFVKTGNPTPVATGDIPAWLPYTINATNFLSIGSELKVKAHFHKDRMDFWNNLYSNRSNTAL